MVGQGWGKSRVILKDAKAGGGVRMKRPFWASLLAIPFILVFMIITPVQNRYEVMAKENGVDQKSINFIRTLKSPYAKAIALTTIAEKYRVQGDLFNAGRTLDEAARLTGEIPGEKDKLDSYIKWLIAQNPINSDNPSEQGINGSLETTMNEMQDSLRQTIAEEYVKTGCNQKALNVVRLMEDPAKDEALVVVGKLFLESDQRDFAERTAKEIALVSHRVELGDEFVRWLIAKKDLKAAAQKLAEMSTLIDGLDLEERDAQRMEMARDYTRLGDYFQAQAQVFAITESLERNKGFLQIAKDAKEQGENSQVMDALNVAVVEATKVEDELKGKDSLNATIHLAVTLLSHDDGENWLQTLNQMAKSISDGEMKVIFWSAEADGFDQIKNSEEARLAMDQAIMVALKNPDGPRKVDLLTDIGDQLIRLGMLSQAGKVWSQAVTVVARMQAEADYKALHFARLVRRIAVNVDSEKAMTMIDNKKSPYDKAMALAEVGRGYLELGQLEDAVTVIRQIPNAFRKAMLLREVAAYCNRSGQAKIALALLDDAVQEVENTRDPELKALEQAEIAREYSRTGEYDRAEALFDSLPDDSVKMGKAMKFAEDLLQSAQLDRAVRIIEKYSVQKERFYNFCILSGMSFKLEQKEAENVLLKKALEIEAETKDTAERDEMLNLASTYDLAYDQPEAAAELIENLSTESGKRDGRRAVARYYFKNHQYEKAMELARKEDIQILEELIVIETARQNAQEGRGEEALRLLRSLREEILKGEAFRYVVNSRKDMAENSPLLGGLSLVGVWGD